MGHPFATPIDGELPSIPEVTLLGEIARGGMGVVYRGRQEFLARDVAVKLLAEHLQGERFAARFRREARILAGIQHPNIVACHTAGTTAAGRCYLVMEFVDGPDLRRWLQEHGRVGTLPALRLVQKVAAALQHAHERGVIHRDVKPENILLHPLPNAAAANDQELPFVPKLVDLGLARMAAESSDTSLTAPGAVMGTPATMAPEQFDAPDTVDFRADIYGLGCVLYQALTGEPAYASTKLTDLVLEKQKPLGPDPSQKLGAIPPAIGQLVAAMLARDPKDRPANYRALIARLDELIATTARAGTTMPATGPAPASAPGGPGLLRTAEFEFLAAGGAIANGGAAARTFPPPSQTLTTVVPARPAAVATPAPRRSRALTILASFVVLLVASLAAPVLLQKPDADESPAMSPSPTRSPAMPPAVPAPAPAGETAAPVKSKLILRIEGELRPDTKLELATAAGLVDARSECRWSIEPARSAHIEAPTSPRTSLELDGLPGDTFMLALEVRDANGVPRRHQQELTLAYSSTNLFGDFLLPESHWIGRPRARSDWRRDDGGGVACAADELPSIRSTQLNGGIWKVEGELRPERGRNGFAQTAACLRLGPGPGGHFAVVCLREGDRGERWSATLLEVEREDLRGGFTFRPLPRTQKQVGIVDAEGKQRGATYTITRRDDEVVIEFGFPAAGATEEYRLRARPDDDAMLLSLCARGGLGVFPSLELW